MRKPFIETLTELVEKDPSIVLIVGDVGFSFLEPFKERFPKNFLNVGIMEQTMMGFAAGLATAGMKPWVYTMSNFVLLRPLEQVRNDICFANKNVKLISVKGSEAYKFLGMSHNLFPGEEEAILSTLPNITKHFPTTDEECKQIIKDEYNRIGPSYISL